MAIFTLPLISPITLLVLSIPLIALLNILLNAYRSPLKGLPGPWYAKFTRLPLKFIILTGHRMQYAHALHIKYGPLVQIAPKEVTIADAEAYKTIYNARLGYLKSSFYTDFVTWPTPGIFAMRNPAHHSARRRLLSRPFGKSALRKNLEPSIKILVTAAVSKIKAELHGNGKVDILKWWFFMAADASAKVMFGDDFGMIAAGKENDFIRLITSISIGAGAAVELPWLETIGSRLPLKVCKQYWPPNSVLVEYGRRAFDSVKKHSSSGPANVFDDIVQLADEGTPALSIEEVCNEATGFISAGTDTTAVTLTYLLWAVLQRPALQSKLEAEVQALAPEDLTDERLETLPLLNAVIQESLRLYGAAPGRLPREVPRGGATLCGFEIPAEIEVSSQAYTMHRLPQLWGADAEEFVPSRWLVDGKFHSADTGNAIFAPWGAGSRICLGLHLAQMELRLATAIFLREMPGLKIAPEMTAADMEMESYFLISPKGHKCFVTL